MEKVRGLKTSRHGEWDTGLFGDFEFLRLGDWETKTLRA